ncbi:MAG: NEW3 domain-containing protein [Thermoplasmatota archaeon]
MSKNRSWKSFIQIAVVFLLIAAGFAVFGYYAPIGSSASAYDVSLVADDADKEVEAGQSVKYYLTITNEGGNQDRYTVTKNVSAEPTGWTVTLSTSSTGNIGSGNTGLITVTVKAPTTATVTSSCLAVITVVSVTDPVNSSAYQTLDTSIKRDYGSEILSPGAKYIQAGKSASYSFSVKNLGNDKDGFIVDVTDKPAGWSANEDFSTSEINPDESRTGTLLVSCPSSTNAGTYQIKIQAKSIHDNTSITTKTISVFVNQTYDVNIQSQGLKEVDISVSRIVEYKVTITNQGNGEDKFDVSVYIPQAYVDDGWQGTLSTSLTNFLEPDKSVNLTFYATAPSKSDNPAVDSIGKFWINATSQGNPAVTRSTQVSCVVQPYYDLDLLNTGASDQTCAPDGTVTFVFELTNLGNSEERFNLWLDYPTGFEQSNVEPSSVRLGAGTSRDITVTIKPKSNVVKAEAYSFTINANITGGPSSSQDFGVTIETEYDVFLGPVTAATKPNGQPGNSYTFQVMVQNIGNDVDQYTLEVEGETETIDTGWTPSLSAYSTPPFMAVDAKYYFNVTVQAPSNAATGSYRFLVTATSQNDALVSQSLYLTVRIPTLYNVDITANKESVNAEYSNATGSPRMAYFDLDVYNKGSAEDDSITLKVKTAPSQFAGKYSIYFVENTKKLITIPQGESKTGKLAVQMPKIGEGIPSGTYSFVVQVTSDNGTTSILTDDKTATIDLSLNLLARHEVKILTDQNSSQVRLGFSKTFNVVVQNRGTSSDSFDMSVEHPNYGTAVDFNLSTIQTGVLSPLAQETVKLTIKVYNSADTNWGSVWCKVLAKYSQDNSIMNEKYYTATFADDFSGQLDSNDVFEQAYPGQRAWYNISLKNTGTRLSDSFKIEVEDSLEFENIEISPSLFTLNTQATKRISINISIPSIDDKIIETGTYELTFKATSAGETTSDTDDVIVHNITLKIKVMPVYKLQFVIPDGSITMETGKTSENIELNITNKGNEPATILIKKDSQTSSSILKWATITPATVSDLKPNSAVSVYAKIKVPSDAAADTVTFYFSAEVSGHSDEAKEVAYLDVIVEEKFLPELKLSDGVSEKEAEPGEPVGFRIQLKNKGNTADTFDITLTADEPTWASFGVVVNNVNTTSKEVTDLAVDDVEEIWLSIDVPDDAPADTPKFTIKATSRGDETKIASRDLYVEVSPNRAVELITNEDTKELIPDVDKSITEIEYDIQVINKGEDDDSFKLLVLKKDEAGGSSQRPETMSLEEWKLIPRSDYPSDVILSKTNTGNIPKGGQVTITVTINVRDYNYDPGTFKTVIWAYSEGSDKTEEDDKYSNELVLTTKIEQTYGLDIDTPRELVPTEPDPDDDSKLFAEFTLKVENTGTGNDTFQLKEQDELSSKFEVSYDTGSFKIGRGETVEVKILVTMDSDTLTGKYDLEFKAISRGEDQNFNEDTDYVTSWQKLTVNVKQTYGVSVDVDNEEKEGEVGNDVTFKLTINNEGNADDDFRLTIREEDNRAWATSTKTKFTLGPKGSSTESLEVTITVRIPEDNFEAEAGLYPFNITVERDSTITSEKLKAREILLLHVDIDETYEHEVTTDEDTKDVKPGMNVTFTFEVYNKGNSQDTYELEIKGLQRSWGRLSQTTITLDPDTDQKVYMTVEVPGLDEVSDLDDIKSGGYDLTVEVTSRGDREARPESLLFTVDLEQVYSAVIPDLDEAGSSSTPKVWDINDKSKLEVSFFIENQGNDQDIFKIVKPSVVPPGWNVDLSSSSQTIEMGEQKEIVVTITFTQRDGLFRGTKGLKFTVKPNSGSLNARNEWQDVYIWITVEAPDLMVDDSSFRNLPSDDDIKVGQENDITIYVMNIGNAPAKEVDVSLYDNGELVQTVTGDVLPGRNNSFDFKWKPGTGSHELEVIVNDDFPVKETDQDNNEVSRDVDLPSFSIEQYLNIYIILALMVIFLVIAIIAALFALNKNREAKELAERMKKSDLGLDKGGPRKVVKEAAGAPMAKGPAGLPPSSAGSAAPLAPIDKKLPAKKENLKVECQKCHTEQIVSIESRPAKVPCKECGVTMLIPEKKS